MNIIKSEELIIDKNTVTLKTICAGDIGYIKERQYIKLQTMIDRITKNV